MKLAISNIAWQQHDDPQVLDLLGSYPVTGIEVAPTKIWPDWVNAGQAEAKKYRLFLENEGFSIPAMQALLFGRPDLQVFDPLTHSAFLEHVKLLSELAAGLGAGVLVFGCPRNRKRGHLSMKEALRIAVDLFIQAAQICREHNCCIGWEPNPVEYGCDFITNTSDAIELVHAVNHPAFQLHLDAAGLHLCGGKIAEHIELADSFCHYHISEPMLAPIVQQTVDHRAAMSALKKIRYPYWASIEMKQVPVPILKDVLEYVMKLMKEAEIV